MSSSLQRPNALILAMQTHQPLQLLLALLLQPATCMPAYLTAGWTATATVCVHHGWRCCLRSRAAAGPAASLQLLLPQCSGDAIQALPAHAPAEAAVAIDSSLWALLAKAAADDCDVV
jgi:hypothetical protein